MEGHVPFYSWHHSSISFDKMCSFEIYVKCLQATYMQTSKQTGSQQAYARLHSSLISVGLTQACHM